MYLLSIDYDDDDDNDRQDLLNKSKYTLFTFQLACRFRMKWNAKKAERKKSKLFALPSMPLMTRQHT